MKGKSSLVLSRSSAPIRPRWPTVHVITSIRVPRLLTSIWDVLPKKSAITGAVQHFCKEPLVGQILEAVTSAVSVPVTLKFRTGWDRSHINAPEIAKIAESAGIAALTLHGRTREDAYRGQAEYDTIAEVKSLVSIPVVANGDIDSPEKAKAVLEKTGADAIMIGRAAQGKPWIFPRNRLFFEK